MRFFIREYFLFYMCIRGGMVVEAASVEEAEAFGKSWGYTRWTMRKATEQEAAAKLTHTKTIEFGGKNITLSYAKC